MKWLEQEVSFFHRESLEPGRANPDRGLGACHGPVTEPSMSASDPKRTFTARNRCRANGARPLVSRVANPCCNYNQSGTIVDLRASRPTTGAFHDPRDVARRFHNFACHYNPGRDREWTDCCGRDVRFA